MGYTDFCAYYETAIEPRLKELDILFKSGEVISPEKAAYLLDIPLTELRCLMAAMSIKRLDAVTTPLIMNEGSSAFCRMFHNEVECGSPLVYAPEDIAYIYGLDVMVVCQAFALAGVREVERKSLRQIMREIKLEPRCS